MLIMKITLFCCAGMIWALWKTRNDVTFGDNLLKDSREAIFRARG